MFDYDKAKDKLEGEANQWASYSDLFMVLSFVFLLMYVTSSLRNGTFSIQKHLEYKRMAHEAADLKEQLRVYNTLKEDYMETGATAEEQDNYQNLMSQLDLLQDEANKEKKELQKQAAEHALKEKALNKYQQMVRNIINSNMISQSRIKKRDNIIEEKNQTIEEKKKEISQRQKEIKGLEKEVSQKKKELQANERQIEKINKDLDQSIAKLKKQAKKYKTSRSKLNKQIANLRQKSEKQIQSLEKEKESVQAKLQEVHEELSESSQKLSAAEIAIQKEKEEKDRLAKKMKADNEQFKKTVSNLQQTYSQELNQKEQEYNKQLSGLQSDFQKKYKNQSERYQAYLKQQEEEYQKEMAEKKTRYEANMGKMQANNKDMQSRLAQAQEREKARKEIIEKVKSNFKKAGVDVNIDGQSGDVVLSFGEEYFDTGRADLKPEMVKILEEFMPIYAKSLFENQKVAQKISSVEIIGYASPTYKGRYVDPSSLQLGDREAVNYNMDLSYRRAKSIFNHIFDKKKMSYENQKNLLPLVKVTGKSFLAEAKRERNVASGVSQKDFCKTFDCKKAQKVLIKFNVEN